MAWVIECHLRKTPSKFRNFHGRLAVIVYKHFQFRNAKVDIYSLKARFFELLVGFLIAKFFFQSKTGVKWWNWVNFCHFETLDNIRRRLCVTICSVTAGDITNVWRDDGAVKITVVTQRNSWKSNIFDPHGILKSLKKKKSNVLFLVLTFYRKIWT